MVKNCVKMDNIFCCFMLIIGVLSYIFRMFCITAGMAFFIGITPLRFYLRQLFILIHVFSYSPCKSVYFNINMFFSSLCSFSSLYSSLNILNAFFRVYFQAGRLIFLHGITSSCGVVIRYLSKKKFSVNKICKDNNCRVLIIEADIETEMFILLNLHNSNSETEQLQTLSAVDLLLSDFSLDDTKTIVFAGDFNLFFNQKIEAWVETLY